MKLNKILLINVEKALLGDTSWNELVSLAEKHVALPKDDPRIMDELKDTDCLLTGYAIPVTREHINVAPNLKYIGTFAIAFHAIDTIAAREKGIPVTNLAGYCTESVAEFTIAALLNELRHLEEGKKRVRNNSYEFGGLAISEIKGKTFGIFGLGGIGARTAELAQGFRANISYWNRSRKEVYESKGISYKEKDDLLSQADFISLNFAHTPETDKFLDSHAFSLIKSGAVVICTVPIETVDLDALEERLKKNDMIFITDHAEQLNAEDPARFRQYANCVQYPAIAFNSKEAKKNMQELFVGNLKNFLDGSPTNVVN